MLDFEFQPMKARALNLNQRAALRRCLRYVDQAHLGGQRLRYELTQYDGFISLVVHSRLARSGVLVRLMMEQQLHVSIGPRGGLKVLSADVGLDSKKATALARKYL